MMLDGDDKKKYGVPPAAWWFFTSTKVRNPHVQRRALRRRVGLFLPDGHPRAFSSRATSARSIH